MRTILRHIFDAVLSVFVGIYKIIVYIINKGNSPKEEDLRHAQKETIRLIGYRKDKEEELEKTKQRKESISLELKDNIDTHNQEGKTEETLGVDLDIYRMTDELEEIKRKEEYSVEIENALKRVVHKELRIQEAKNKK